MALMAWIVLTGVLRGHLSQAFAFPPGAFHLTPAFFLGLGSAMMFATYDYWGYYNITFLGGEVKDAARTVPRAILISIVLVAAIYLAMNISVLAVLPWQGLLGAQNEEARRAVISRFMEAAYGSQVGPALGRAGGGTGDDDGVLQRLLAAAGLLTHSVCGGTGRQLFSRLRAAACKGFPHVSLLVLGAAAMCFCFFSLADVIAALVVLRILLQFLMQHVGVIYLRRTQPEMKRPFRIWLYPLPPLLAIAGFSYILIERANFQREIAGGGVVIALGAVMYVVREGMSAASLEEVPLIRVANLHPCMTPDA